jgi:stage III sporulation protein SpoIIIAA
MLDRKPTVRMAKGNLFLVGMMGAGKTTLGRALARRLGREFADTDKVLVERTGVPVTTIFEIEGEEGFPPPRIRRCSRSSPAGRPGDRHRRRAPSFSKRTASSCAATGP